MEIEERQDQKRGNKEVKPHGRSPQAAAHSSSQALLWLNNELLLTPR